MLPAFVATTVAYFVGTIPFGLLIARWFQGVDIRTLGSGNIGATNVGRTLGAKWGALVLTLDALKGALPTVLLPLTIHSADDVGLLHLRVACGLAAVLGHMFPCWLRFRGGKGVATSLGAIVVLSPWGTLAAVATFAVSFGLFRIASLSSLLASAAFLIAVMWQLWPHPFSGRTWSLASFAVAVPALILVRHRSNLTRLLRGEEARYRTKQAEDH